MDIPLWVIANITVFLLATSSSNHPLGQDHERLELVYEQIDQSYSNQVVPDDDVAF